MENTMNMKTTSNSPCRRCIAIIAGGWFLFGNGNCAALLWTPPCGCTRYVHFAERNNAQPSSMSSSGLQRHPMASRLIKYQKRALRISTVDIEVPEKSISKYDADDGLLSWKDILPLSIYTAMCLFAAIIVSTYEDYDVTHTRPNPSTLRLPTSIVRSSPITAGSNHFNFIGAATRGMGWGPSDRGIQGNGNGGVDNDFFEEWYGKSATTLQWKPSYNEIMLRHRSERVPRWNELGIRGTVNAYSKEELQQAVLQLYNSLDELHELKLLSDDYQWDDVKERLNPTMGNKYSLGSALEYSMDILKSTPAYYESNTPAGELPELIGFDWGSCAWRHCGAKADAQESIAELYSDVGMLEPFECRFIIDIVERSIRDVLAIVPDDLKPHKNGILVQARSYEAYISKAGNDIEEMGLDFEYEQALSQVRDLSFEE